MKTLNEYLTQVTSFYSTNLNEYLDTKKIKYIDNKFPKSLNYDDIVSFLEQQGFKRATDDITANMEMIYNWFEKNGKGYIIKKYNDKLFWVRFFKGGKLSKNNPIFVMQHGDGTDENYKLFGFEYRWETGDEYDISYQEFSNKMHKIFGWD